MSVKDLITIVLAFILFFFEIFLLTRLSGVGVFFAWHLLVIIILLSYAYITFRLKDDLLYPLLLLAFTIFAGPFGLGTFILTVFLKPLFALFATPQKIWLEGLFPKASTTLFDKITQRIRSRWDDYSHLHEASSFENVFTFGSLSDKQAVLDVISTDFHPQYSPLLKEALKDSHNPVLIQAAAITTKIDYDFHEILKKLEKVHQRSPDNLEVILKLAEHADAYASLGILDNLRRKEMAALAIKYYRLYYKSHPDNKNIWLSIGHLLFFQKDYAAFITWYKEGQKKFGVLPSILHSWFLESLYKLGLHDEFLVSLKGT